MYIFMQNCRLFARMKIANFCLPPSSTVAELRIRIGVLQAQRLQCATHNITHCECTSANVSKYFPLSGMDDFVPCLPYEEVPAGCATFIVV